MQWSLKTITLANFRGVTKQVTLDFSNTPPGLYFICGFNRVSERLGSNGAGKSSMFSESIIWALTGRISGSQRPSSDVENRSANKAQTLVRLEFTLDDQIHTVERTRNPNSLKLNGIVVEQQQIFNVLPLSDTVLRKSVLLGQFGEMFLSLRSELQSRIFTETLSLDKWIHAADAAGAQATNVERALAITLRQKEGCERVLGEVWDQYDLAEQGEKDFEKQIEKQINDARQHVETQTQDCIDLERALLRVARVKDDDESHMTQLHDARANVKLLARSLNEAQTRSTRTDGELVQIKRRLATYRDATEFCPECKQSVNKEHLQNKRNELLDEFDRLQILADRYSDQLASVRGLSDKAEARCAELEVDLAVALQAQAGAALASENYNRALQEKARAITQLKKLTQTENPFTVQCDRLENRIKELKAEKKQLEADKFANEEKLAIYQFWVRGFREIRLAQMDEALFALEIATSKHAESLGLEGWRIHFATDRETKRGAVSLGFNVQLYPPGSDEPVNLDSYCGGEIQRWQLATTFGLAEVLLARAGVFPDFECHDEPTAHLSPEGIEDLLECLSDRARDLQRRIFLIDHNSMTVGSFDGIITVAKDKVKGCYIEDTGGVIQIKEHRRERVVL